MKSFSTLGTGTISDKIPHMILHDHIDPIWDDSYRSLEYLDERFKDQEQEQQWFDAGHPPECLVIQTYAQPRPVPGWTQQVLAHWPRFRDFGICFHKFPPGRYFPDHVDLYKSYRKKFDVDLDEVIRILVYLEDCCPGQITTLEDRTFTNCQSGDWIGWTAGTRHSVANFGNHDRYALAITCHL